eukprot:GDKH01013434.1.p2 GENE.GDKH01013434.1~~GDKH01013434.1.p2  ORF type:complete len:80 (-),score=11.44 GDKH01013434.1:159-398(-)
MSAPKEILFNAQMTCGGCSSAITRILNKVEGVKDVQCDLEKQSVKVVYEGSEEKPDEVMLEKLQKWAAAAGKEVSIANK